MRSFINEWKFRLADHGGPGKMPLLVAKLTNFGIRDFYHIITNIWIWRDQLSGTG